MNFNTLYKWYKTTGEALLKILELEREYKKAIKELKDGANVYDNDKEQ